MNKNIYDEEKGYQPFKKIFATIDAKTFAKFTLRCKIENIKWQDALTGLVKAYSNGCMLIIPKEINKKVENINYAKEHKEV